MNELGNNIVSSEQSPEIQQLLGFLKRNNGKNIHVNWGGEVQQPQDVGQWLQGGIMNQDEAKDPMQYINKLLSPLAGVGSLADVAYNTNNVGDALTIPARYLLNILRGVGGMMLPGVKAPEFKGTGDVMKKHNITTGNQTVDDVLGFAGDIVTDPSMYMGGIGVASKLGKLGKGAKTATEATKLTSLAGKAGGKVLPSKGLLNILTEYMNPNKLKTGQKTGSVIMNGIASGIRPGRDAQQLLVDLLKQRSNGMLLPNQKTGSLIMS